LKIVNLTPHPLRFVLPDGSEMEIPPSGTVARLEERIEPAGQVAGIPVIRKTLGRLVNLPEPEPNTIYVASLPVAQAASADGRTDVYAIGESLRDEQGRVVGAKSLATF